MKRKYKKGVKSEMILNKPVSSGHHRAFVFSNHHMHSSLL